jgi:hypothetical protein
VLVLVGIGAFAITVGVVALRAGKGGRLSVDHNGQQNIAAFIIPFGVAFLILALVLLTTAVRRRFEVRRLSRRYARPDPGSAPDRQP